MATRKTNKTAHVLNLLSNGSKSEDSNTETTEEVNDPVLEMSADSDEMMDDFIREELENELEPEADEEADEEVDEEAAPAESPATALDPTPASQLQTEPVQPQTSPILEENLIHQPDESASISGVAHIAPSESSDEDNTIYVNIVEELVKERVDESIRELGVCTCHRCRIDCIALALNNLPPKYCVMKPNETSPLLNYFSFKYQSMIVAQVTRACMMIKEKPNHDK